jgi:RNA recognition motif-containing protein
LFHSYISKLPSAVTVARLTEFLNAALKLLGLVQADSAVVSVTMDPLPGFLTVELRTVEEAAAAVTHLNGLQIGSETLNVGKVRGTFENQLTLRSPKWETLNILANSIFGSDSNMNAPALSTSSESLSNVIIVANLPSALQEAQIKELFGSFGEVRTSVTLFPV